ncbi:hypothetical protein [Micromonospora sp. WMMC250]|uniref:hypothetical protein n=1 Tax=Micromonospora sp. WMMC250 TaxID=3014781 RepID=UPI0022B600F9|nr:hypothetical protein [Micromonospora sp. WMMC250]MCZ7376566.1 hypothetical protein [Micromonospora sp. WMMC250]
MRPDPGAVVLVGPECSVQFSGSRAVRVQVVSVDERTNYPGWIWLTGYVLGPRGQAVDKRELYVQAAGLKVLQLPAVTVAAPGRRARVPAPN